MKYAKLVLGGASSGVVASNVLGNTPLSDHVAQGEVAVLLTDAVAATERFVEIMETLRRCREQLREDPVVQAFAGTATQFATTSLVLGNPKDASKNSTAVENTTLLTAIAPSSSVALVLPNAGGLSVRSRSALQTCIEVLNELKFNPA